MTHDVNRILAYASAFAAKPRPRHVPVHIVNAQNFSSWLKRQSKNVQTLCRETGFSGQADRTLCVRDSGNRLLCVLLGTLQPLSLYSAAAVVTALRRELPKSVLASTSFFFGKAGLESGDLDRLTRGWGLGCLDFSVYRTTARSGLSPPDPVLVPDTPARGKDADAFLRSLAGLRGMINAPPNDMGPDAIEAAARVIARRHRASVSVTTGTRLEKDFPLIHAVGKASSVAPRLIDIRWPARKGAPKLTLVGKGVAFDTGGLNIKPTPMMALMKKDMAGAAHVLALADRIAHSKLPVALRVLIPAVENAIAGNAFRPGDIYKSRQGLYIENTNTDAEGRLILADALTYACEDKPDLIIDFATLTGSARAALGPDIPAIFTNAPALGEKLAKLGFANEDPVWPMPLWSAYRKHLDSSIADMHNSSGVPGDLVYSALFLQQFVQAANKGQNAPDWIHLDIYGWELTGRPGRPKGGADNGLRAVMALMEDRYGSKKRRR